MKTLLRLKKRVLTLLCLLSCIINAHGDTVEELKFMRLSETERTAAVIPPANSNATEYAGPHIDVPEYVEIDGVTYTVTEIIDGAFWESGGSHRIYTVSLPSTLKKIGSGAFKDCRNLESIDIPDGVVKIGGQAFFRCTSLESVVIPNKVSVIAKETFYHCTGLKSVTIGESVDSIKVSAFNGCSSITEFYFLSDSPPKIVGNLVPGNDLQKTIYVPAHAVDAYREVFSEYSYSERYEIVGVTKVASEEYYLQESSTGKFLSRGEYWGTCATVDKYGIPFEWNSTDGSLKFLDNNLCLYETDDNSLYTDGTSTGFTFEEVEGGYLLKSKKSDRYLTILDAAYKHQIVNVTDDPSAATVWQLKSKAEHDAIVAGYVDENYANVIEASNISVTTGGFTAHLATLAAIDKTSAIGTARFTKGAGDWNFYEVRPEARQPLYGTDYCELWQATGWHTQTISGLDPGIYKVTVQGFERTGSWTNSNILGDKGYEITTATLSANGEEINLKSWLSGKTDDDNPNDTSEAIAKFDEGEYLNELYTYVDETGILTLTLCKPGHVGYDWVLFNNFTLTHYTSVVAVSGITLSQTSASLTEGETITLTAVVSPDNATDKTIVWSSSDEDIATVNNNGVVTAVAEGETTITAEAGGKSASCAVTVEKKTIAVSGITLSQTSASLTEGETITLTAVVSPDNATDKTIVWSSSDEDIATVDNNGVVTAVAEGEATITVSATDGSCLSAMCVVIVVAEEEEEEDQPVDYANMVYFEDATAFVNTTLNLPLQLKNENDITAVQFDVYLPEGVTIEKNSRGKFNITFNEDRADNSTHTLSSNLQADGAVRVICYSIDSELFWGNEGAIFNFPLEVSDMVEGDYSIIIKKIIITEQSGKKHEIASITSTLNVLAVALGDCNRDNAVDVADIVTLANHILNNPVEVFVEKAADFNKDNAVDVADIVAIANFILGGNTSAAHALTREVLLSRAASAGYSFDILPFVLAAEGTKTISLDLADPTESFTAFQCDLYLPEGISIDTNNRGKYKFSFNEERTAASYHALSGSLQPDGSVRILCYSTDSEVFFGTDGALINIPLTADASLKSGIYEFSIANTVLTYVDGRKVEPELYRGSIIVGDGGEVKSMKLYGKYTAGVLKKFTSALSANESVTSVDLTDAVSVAESGMLTTGNPNTLIYLAENAALANVNNVVCGDECNSLLLADGYAFAAQTGFVALQASYTRELAAGKYGTITLPFAPENENYIFYELTSVGNNTLTFDEVDEPQAKTPYLYSLRDGKSATAIIGTGAMVSSELIMVETVGWQTVGSFAYQSLQTNDEGYYAYAATDNQFHRVTKTLSVKPFRAYLKGDMDSGVVLKVRTRNGNETLIDASEVEDMLPKVYYDLSGRRVEYPTKGVYVVNGKKVVL